MFILITYEKYPGYRMPCSMLEDMACLVLRFFLWEFLLINRFLFGKIHA